MKDSQRRILGLVMVFGLALSCSDDSSEPDTGFLEIHASFEDLMPVTKTEGQRADSVRGEVRDRGGVALGSSAVWLPDSAETAILEFELAVGSDFEALLQAEGRTAFGRAGTHFASQSGLGIEKGRMTRANLFLKSVLPAPPVVDGEPAAPTYRVRWKRVPGAIGYVLRESAGGEAEEYEVSDTVRIFTPGVENGSARLRRSDSWVANLPAGVRGGGRFTATERTYRVRAVLPLGPGAFSDSVAIDLDDWYDLPRVATATPADSAEGVRDDGPIRISFDRVMDHSSLASGEITITNLRSGARAPCTRLVEDGDTVVVLTPIDRLGRGDWHRIRVSTGFRDLNGRPIDQDPFVEGLQALVSDFRVEEYDPLRVIEVFPAEGATDADPNSTVSVRFNRAVAASSVIQGRFTVSDSGGPVAGSPHLRDQGLRLEFWASDPLAYDIEHEIFADTTLVDVARGEPLDQDPLEPGLQPFFSSFKTMLQPRGPRVVQTDPIPGEEHHPTWEPIEITFDRAIDPASVIPGQGLIVQVLLFGEYFNVSGEVRVSADSLRVTFVPGADLTRDKPYRVTVAGGEAGVRDALGVPLDQDPYTPGYQSYGFDFQAEQNVRVGSIDPGSDESGVAWDAVVEVDFATPVQPGSVDESTFFLLRGGERVTADRAVSADSLRATLTPRSLLQSYQVYEVVVTTGVRSRRGGSFDQEWDEDGHQEFRSTFRTDNEKDPPRVDGVSPEDGTDGVPIDAGIQIVFSEQVRPAGVIQYTYVTRGDSLGARVQGSVTPSADSLSAFFDPAALLDYYTEYHLHVDTWVTDRFGNRLDQDAQQEGWQKFHSIFTTQKERDRPQVVGMDTPGGLTGAPVTGPIWIDFTEPMDRESIPAALHVESAGGSVAGEISFENDDQRVAWTPLKLLRHDREYTVRVDSLALDLAGNPLDQIPLTERLDPFEDTFRTEPDTVGPVVQSIAPSDGSTEVTVDVAPLLTFSEPVDPQTITPLSVQFGDSTGAIGASRSLSADGRRLTITPDAPLAFDTRYEIGVSASVTDTLGNPYDNDPDSPGEQPFASWFRTQQETIPPRVLALLLDGNPGNISVDTDVRVVFSESVDPATVGETTFRVLLDDVPIAGSRTIAATGDTATFAPAGPLEYGETYQVSVAGVGDLVGNLLDQDPQAPGEQPFEEAFETQSDLDRPYVTGTEPFDGAMNVDPDALLRIVFSEPMDTESFTPYNPGLFLEGNPVATSRVDEPGDSSFVFIHGSLERGKTYELKAGTDLQDMSGNFLDQDPDSAGGQMFTASFEVGDRPVADAGPGDCSNDATGEASFDASASYDPDGTIAEVIWEWGDGSSDTLDGASGLTVSHDYACADDAGCDGVDNDGDGRTDEDGDDGCDESYRVVLTVIDDHGYRSTDTTGVSFCVFRVLSSLPDSGAVGVDTLMSPVLTLTRSCDPASVDSTAVWMTIAEGDTIPVVLGIEDDEDRVILLDPVAPLLPDTLYTVHAGPGLKAVEGAGLDQDPCAAGIQEFTATFRTLAPPVQPPRLVPPSQSRRLTRSVTSDR